MKDDNLIRSLKALNEDFDPFFHTRVLAKVEAVSVWYRLSWKSLVPSLTLAAICVLWVVIQDGQLNAESILGLTHFEYELTNYLMYL